jgi:AcrR family transcriptional regulator
MFSSDEKIEIGSSKEVKDKILESAEILFSEKGFSGTKVREITAMAGCNLAAINYHFGGKDNLYYQVIRQHLNIMRNVRIAGINKVMNEKKENISLEQLLRAFAEAFVEPFVDKKKSQRFMKLMIHEFLDPKMPKKMFIEEMVTPVLNAFGNAMKKIYPEIKERTILTSTISIVGQLMHSIHLNEIFTAEKNTGLSMPSMQEMIDHIVTFSAAGIRAFVGQKA